MNETLIRIITSIVGGALFFGSFFISTFLFSLVLLAILLYIIVIEWPQLMGGYASPWYWLVTPFYPIVPFVGLIVFGMFFETWSTVVPLYPFLVAWTADICSYAAGMLIGHHKIAPSISPNKTWEGLAGGFAGTLAMNFILIPYMDNIFPDTFMYKVICSVAGIILIFAGDMLISWLKRRVNVKDTGRLLPGHGGLLDRFDSVMFLGLASLGAAVLFRTLAF